MLKELALQPCLNLRGWSVFIRGLFVLNYVFKITTFIIVCLVAKSAAQLPQGSHQLITNSDGIIAASVRS